MVDAPPRPAVTSAALPDREELSEYGAVVTGLRMATNYTFSVAPVEGRLQSLQHLPAYARNRNARTIMAPTKGFSARATLCLPDVSEVEVHTGPHFSGRIAVEANEQEAAPPPPPWRRAAVPGAVPGAVPDESLGRGLSGQGTRPVDEPCAVAGDASSPRESYTLRIDHRRCGSHVNRSTVATFILVQENLPILTHSTRRFLVLCTFQPDALIVRAGISLPTVHGEHRNREDLAEPAHGNQLGGGGGGGGGRSAGGGGGVATGVEAGPAEVMAYQLQQEQVEDDALAMASGGNGVPSGSSGSSGRQQRRHAARALGLGLDPDSAPGGSQDEAREVQMVLTSVLLVVGVVLSAITAWWFAPRRKRTRSIADDALTEDSASVYQNYENSLRDSDCSSSSSSLGSSTVGTVNSSILSSLSRHHWAAAALSLDLDRDLEKKGPPAADVDAKPAASLDVPGGEDEFGEVPPARSRPRRPGHLEAAPPPPSSLVFTIRLPDASGAVPVLPRLTAPVVVPSDNKSAAAALGGDDSSACSSSVVSLGLGGPGPESLSSQSDA
ncbi:MDM10-complementing protein 1 [Frankliniella fusca]|uniref:MDM10-complementing protein 1 n=1 Tax=Frankliniella fusca TaxID=407009 RepID=A0AAE1H4I2_9NEOP|nr:MDM10-complementing protein 1 [Frankliniella fusca]